MPITERRPCFLALVYARTNFAFRWRWSLQRSCHDRRKKYEATLARSWPLPAATVLARCVGKLPYVSTGCSTINVRHAPPPPCTWVRAHSPTIPRFTRGDKLTSGLGISRALSSSIAHPGRLVRRRPCQSDSVCKRIERKAKGCKDSERNPSSLRLVSFDLRTREVLLGGPGMRRTAHVALVPRARALFILIPDRRFLH